jgi:hypothetical protein
MHAYFVAVAIVLSSWATTAVSAPIECRAELPSGAKEYWSWRILDGKRCWYPGRPGMSKDNLRWPQSEPPREEVVQIDPPEELRNHYSQPKNDGPNVSQPDDRELTFAERWPY